MSAPAKSARHSKYPASCNCQSCSYLCVVELWIRLPNPPLNPLSARTLCPETSCVPKWPTTLATSHPPLQRVYSTPYPAIVSYALVVHSQVGVTAMIRLDCDRYRSIHHGMNTKFGLYYKIKISTLLLQIHDKLHPTARMWLPRPLRVETRVRYKGEVYSQGEFTLGLKTEVQAYMSRFTVNLIHPFSVHDYIYSTCFSKICLLGLKLHTVGGNCIISQEISQQDLLEYMQVTRTN
jgi:hypothetical protein